MDILQAIESERVECIVWVVNVRLGNTVGVSYSVKAQQIFETIKTLKTMITTQRYQVSPGPVIGGQAVELDMKFDGREDLHANEMYEIRAFIRPSSEPIKLFGAYYVGNFDGVPKFLVHGGFERNESVCDDMVEIFKRMNDRNILGVVRDDPTRDNVSLAYMDIWS